jgi:hypothetical protein
VNPTRTEAAAPDHHRRVSEPYGLVGRADEVEPLASLLDGARNAGSALVIKGEPGVGEISPALEGGGAGARAGFSVLTTTGEVAGSSPVAPP